MFINNNSSQQNMTFERRHNLKKELPEIRSVFNKVFYGLKSPSKMSFSSNISELEEAEIILQQNRKILENTKDGYFDKFLTCMYYDRVGNCAEYAELSKIILQLNNINKCDVFEVWAKSKDGKLRTLDHCITALNVKNKDNDKKHLKPFIPRQNQQIFDMWLDNFWRTIKSARDRFLSIGLKKNDTILLKSVATMEMGKKEKEALQKRFPRLLIH